MSLVARHHHPLACRDSKSSSYRHHRWRYRRRGVIVSFKRHHAFKREWRNIVTNVAVVGGIDIARARALLLYLHLLPRTCQ